MQIKLFTQQSLAEIGQPFAMRFALANLTNEGAEAQMTLVKCRDFLMDALYANHHPNDKLAYPIYGFNYDVQKNPLDCSKTVFILEFPNADHVKFFKQNLGLLNAVEEFNGFNPTVVHEADGHVNMLVSVGPSEWLRNCISLNIYTMIMKFCGLQSYTTGQSMYEQLLPLVSQYPAPCEVSYLHSVTPRFFEFCIQNLNKISEEQKGLFVNGQEIHMPIQSVHNYSGIRTWHRYVVLQSDVTPFFKKMKDMFQQFKLEKELFNVKSLQKL